MHNCGACGGSLGDTLLEIPNLPLVDSFCVSRELALKVPRFHIELRQCEHCSTIQIASPPDTTDIYKSYIYESSSSPDLEDHFSAFSTYVSELEINKDDSILEIGANDGLLLRQLVRDGFTRLVAVDPSPQTASIDLPNVEVLNDFFNPKTMSAFDEGSFSLIVANNCFSHIPRLLDVLRLCAKLLSKKGTIIIEVQSTLDLVEGVVFDYIYHEHYFYHSATSFDNLATLAGLEIYKIEHVNTKGGSFRFLLGHPGARDRHSSIAYWKFREAVAGIHSIDTWLELRDYLNLVKARLKDWVSHRNRPLFGYGASATGTVFISFMGLENTLSSIVDDNSKRQRLYAPGSALPVHSLDEVSNEKDCIILAWRHSATILPRLKARQFASLLPLPFPTPYD